MKEYLHLFTKVEGWKPEENGLMWICLDKELRPSMRLHKRGLKWNGTTDPVYVLDLSKLTTKARAADAIEEAAKESYENCEWISERDEVVEKWINWLSV